MSETSQAPGIRLKIAEDKICLNNGGNSGDNLEKPKPEQQLLQGSLLDGKVVQLQHRCAIENLVETWNGVHILQVKSQKFKYALVYKI